MQIFSIFTATPRTPQGILKSREDRNENSKRVIFNLVDSEEDEDPLQRTNKSPRISGTLKLQNKTIAMKPTIRASPKIVVPETPKAKNGRNYKSPEIPGKRIKRTESEERVGINDEMDKFKVLFPDEECQMKAKQLKDKAGAKKTPFKSKIKKVVPRTKKTHAKEKMDLSWFDSDSAFGFGVEE